VHEVRRFGRERRFNHIFLPIHIYLTPPAGMI